MCSHQCAHLDKTCLAWALKCLLEWQVFPGKAAIAILGTSTSILPFVTQSDSTCSSLFMWCSGSCHNCQSKTLPSSAGGLRRHRLLPAEQMAATASPVWGEALHVLIRCTIFCCLYGNLNKNWFFIFFFSFIAQYLLQQ